MQSSEAELFEKLKNKDRNAMEYFVKQHTEALYRTCLGQGFTKNEAEDIVQSCWLGFMENLSRFEGRSSLKTFLFAILFNKSSEFIRKGKKTVATENVDELVDSHFDQSGHWILSHSPVDPQKFFESSQNLSLIEKCLDLLPSNHKVAFMLKEIEDKLSEEICHILKITASNLGVILFRARNQLRECIERKTT